MMSRKGQGASIDMTMPAPEAYLGFETKAGSSFTVTLWNGATLEGSISSAMLNSVAAASGGSAWINIDVANGGSFNYVDFTEALPTTDTDYVYDISYGNASQPIAVPLPALAGTVPGFAAAVLGMLGLRRGRGRRS
jgi:hypothetical protein